MLTWRGHRAYFDADNLSVRGVWQRQSFHRFNTLVFQTISKEKLKEGVESSCCLLLVLNDEVMKAYKRTNLSYFFIVDFGFNVVRVRDSVRKSCVHPIAVCCRC